MTDLEIVVFLRNEWCRLSADATRKELPDGDYERYRLLRQIDEETVEEQGLVALIRDLTTRK